MEYLSYRVLAVEKIILYAVLLFILIFTLFITKNNLRDSQRCPVKFCEQVHTYDVKPTLVQFPLFRQRVLLQTPTASSEK